MTDVRIQQALQQLRSLAGEAAGNNGPQQAGGTQQADFAGMLKDALGTVNDIQQQSSATADSFLRGENVPLVDVMVASQKAKVAFEATKEVRNRFLEAYQEISRMQV
ncbi:MAG: flagellar hook-basal body complex protein FliE [Ectothiorhodospiraceae bacterium]|jgi:flagellar hook-basal body complex protein FliE